jgi:hypothetical protein
MMDWFWLNCILPFIIGMHGGQLIGMLLDWNVAWHSREERP